MANTYVIHDARLVEDAEAQTLPSGDAVTTLRLADNPPHKKDPLKPARFVRGRAWGKLGESAAKLSKGDVVTVSGSLGVEVNKDDDTKRYDVMRIDSIRVHKSDTFYGREGGQDQDEQPAKGKGKQRADKDPFADA